MLLAFMRVSRFFFSMDIMVPAGPRGPFKIAFSCIMSLIISIGIDLNVEIANMYILIYMVIMEFLTGLALGYMTSLCFNGLKIAGSMMDMQLGLMMASMYDPNSQSQTTLISNITHWMGVVIFFIINGHHILIKGIQHSFEIIKVGEPIFLSNFDYIVNVFVEVFIIGFRISIPIMLALFMKDLILGLISKSVPSLNVMMISMPLKILVGILFFIMGLPFIGQEIADLLSNIREILEGTLSVGALPLGIILSNDDKTEEPTPKKLREARKSGNIAKSPEISTAITLIVMIVVTLSMSDKIFVALKQNLIHYLDYGFSFELNKATLYVLVKDFLISFSNIFFPIGIMILVSGLVGNLIQTKMLFTTEPIKPKLSKLNPLNGFKNMFSGRAFGQLIKSIAIIVILFYIGESYFNDNFIGIIKSSNISIDYLYPTIIKLVGDLLKKIAMAMVVIAVLDYAYQKYNHKKSLKMTKQEIKEEFKQAEGNPEIKGKIKQKQKEMARMRMMQAVPTATVIVTNPTHISIAIRYERGRDESPVVVAKGADNVAFKIREIAKEHKIPIIENKPLARLMYKEVEIDEQIPESMYKAVAEVLVAVYKMKNKL